MALYELYQEKLLHDPKPGNVLAHYYSELFEVPFLAKNITMFNKLVKEFDKLIVFESISDAFSMENVNHTHVYNLFKYFCRKRLESQVQVRPKLLDPRAVALQIEKAKARHLKVRSPFDE